jgi:hypothetical protein
MNCPYCGTGVSGIESPIASWERFDCGTEYIDGNYYQSTACETIEALSKKSKWIKEVPEKPGYYWAYDYEYDIMWFVQRVKINNRLVWFDADGVSEMALSKEPVQEVIDNLWWYELEEPLPPEEINYHVR